MIQTVAVVNVNVNDSDRSLDFFVNKIGLKVRTDFIMPDGFRWLELDLPKGGSRVAIVQNMEGEATWNKFSGIYFECDDLQATYEDLVSKGVAFNTTPILHTWGWWSQFEDPDGNIFGLYGAVK